MSELKVTPAQIQSIVTMAKSFVLMARLAASFTPTKVDDQAVATVEALLARVEPFVNQQWFADFINGVIASFSAKAAQ